jgi:hypothetical protein
MRRGVTFAVMIGVFMLAALVLGAFPAGALPIASGAKCKSDWVNNPAALACFIQGEQDASNGVAHPHYVACTGAGEIFCCQDTASGGQNCEAVKTGGVNNLLATIVAMQGQILATQAKVIVDLKGIIASLGDLQIKVDDVRDACAPPDLVPVPIEGSDPPSYCRGDASGNLIVRVRNQGFSDAIASTLRVTFTTPTGPVPVNVATPLLHWGGGTADVTVPIPPACFDPHDPFPHACNFLIEVDAAGVVAESNEINNNVAGVCVPIL